MAVTVVATVGSASANAFVSVAEADAYLEARLNASLWTGDEAKKIAVIEATREVSALTFQGYRVTETQALSWPRFNAPDPDGISSGVYYATTVIPQRVKDATCELALEFLRAGTTDIAVADPNAGVIQKTVGPLTTAWAPGQRATGLGRFPRVMAMVAPLLAAGAGQVRLTR